MTRRGWWLFTVIAVVWGVPYLFIKVALTDLHPVVLVSLRCLLGCVVLLPVAVAGTGLRSLRGHLGWIALFAALEIGVPFVLLALAETRLSSSLTGLLVAMVPLLAAVVSRLLGLDDSLDPWRVAGLLVGFGGVALLVGVDVRGGDLLAVLAVAGAAVGYTLGPVLLATRLRSPQPLAVIAVAFGLVGVGLLPWALVQRPDDLAAVRPLTWLSVVVLGVVTSALAFLVFFALVREVGPARASVITYLNPVVAVLLGVTFLGEALTPAMIAGFVLILVGSWAGTRRRRGSDPDRPAPGHSHATREASRA